MGAIAQAVPPQVVITENQTRLEKTVLCENFGAANSTTLKSHHVECYE